MGESRLSLAVLVGAALAPAGLAAEPEPALRAAGDDVEVREARMDLDIRFRGLVAEGEARHRFEAEGETDAVAEGDAVAVYRFSLPADAAVTGLKWREADGDYAEALAVDAQVAGRTLPRPALTDAEPDRALLRMIARGDEKADYELRLFPVGPEEPAEVRVRWIAPLSFEGDRARLHVPARGPDERLARARVRFRADPAPGARAVRALHAGNEAVSEGLAGDGAAETLELRAAPSEALELSATSDFAGARAITAQSGVREVSEGTMAVAAWAAFPPAGRHSDPPADRVLVLADVSRSMGAQGRARAAEIARAVADRTDAKVEAIVFDREARRALGDFRSLAGEDAAAFERALAPDRAAGGTDLIAALEAAAPILEADDPPAFVLAISDDVWPSSLSPARAEAALGRAALGAAPIAAVTLLPDDGPAPAEDGPLAALARASGGAAITARRSHPGDLAAEVLARLFGEAPLAQARFERDGLRFGGLAGPGELAPGEAALVVGFYRAEDVPDITLAGDREGEEVTIPAPRGGALESAAFPLAALRADARDLVPLAPPEPGAPDAEERALATLLEGALAQPVVTPRVSLVIPGGDAFGRERAREARARGPWLYRRAPPPEEPEIEPFDPRAATEPAAARPDGETGTLGPRTIRRAFHSSLPRIRHCYHQLMLRDLDAAGELTLIAELRRGEVVSLEAQRGDDFSPSFRDCVVDAAYDTRVPRVALGREPEPLTRARLTLSFRFGYVRIRPVEISARRARE